MKTFKLTATDKTNLAKIDAEGKVVVLEIYNRFTRIWNSLEKLVKAGVLKKQDGGWSYTATYTRA